MVYPDKSLYFVRHGETFHNRLKIIQGSGVDSELNQKGIKQSQQFFESYKNSGFELVVSSALRRSIQTIKPFIQLGIPHIAMGEFNEISWGIFEGQKPSQQMILEYNKMLLAWRNGDFTASLEGGESAQELVERVGRGLSFVRQRSESKILVCTHGRTLRCLLTLIQNEPVHEMEKYTHKNTGLYIVEQTGQQLNLLTHNDTRHLGE